jgi:hypothetical protein
MRKFITILFFITAIAVYANDFDYGLYFKSYKSLGNDRTSLVLNNSEPININNELALSFDLFIRNETVFGNAVRIIGNTNESITLSFSADRKDNRYPSFVINKDFYTISDTIDLEDWFNVKITFSTEKDSLFLSYKNIHQSYPLNFNKWENLKIFFGVCDFPGFKTSECAPVNVRDIKIIEKGRLVSHWELKQHNKNSCYDLVNNIPAIATNITYNPVTGKDSAILVKRGYPAGISTNELIYDRISDELLSYSLDEQTTSRFSFEKQAWEKQTPGKGETRFWHHTVSVNFSDSSLIAFGGYGYYKYKNDLFRLDLKSNIWTKNNLIAITPRYSPASAIVDNKLYVFGGRGSESGQQEVNPQNYYDLYSIDLETNEVKTVWRTDVGSEFIPCGNMIYNRDDSCFYVLTNKDGGTLFSIHIAKPEIQEISISIKQSLNADFPFYTLFYSPDLKKIFALFAKNYKSGGSDIIFYEISYPPFSLSEISQQLPIANDFPFKLLIILVIVLCSIAVTVLLFRVKKKNTNKNSSFSDKKTDQIEKPDIDVLEEDINFLPHLKSGSFEKTGFDRTKSCISLLGGFNIKDSNGIDITEKFTPRLKSLFLLLFLYTETDYRGLTDKEIEDYLWMGKDEESARNNRSVY